MSSEIQLVLICGVFGLVFAGLAAWLTTTRGNTISEVLNSQHFDNAEAVRLEILDKVKFASGVPVVALFAVALAVAVVLPIYAMRVASTGWITVSGPVGLAHLAHAKVGLTDSRVDPTGSYHLQAAVVAGVQRFVLYDNDGDPTITVSVTVDPLTGHVCVKRTDDRLARDSCLDAHLDLPNRDVEVQTALGVPPSEMAQRSLASIQPANNRTLAAMPGPTDSSGN